MSVTTTSALTRVARAPAGAHATLGSLRAVRHGALSIHLPDGSAHHFGRSEPRVDMRLGSWQPVARALRSGGTGLAESYVAGEWTTSSLPELMGLVLRNRAALEDVLYGSWWGRIACRLQRLGRRPFAPPAQELDHGFYQLWLDPSMNFSGACFDGLRAQSLEQAQGVKVRRVLQMAKVQAGHRVLEIGCGWGALAEMATSEFRADYTGTTVFPHRLAYARWRLAEAGLDRYCDLRRQDWRSLDVGGPFDAVCSIETLETVGRAHWPRYFDTLRRMLKPHGHACIQTVVVADRLRDHRSGGSHAVREPMFPGGRLISRGEFHAAAAAAGLRVVDGAAFGDDYAETLRRWRERLLARAEDVRALGYGYDERFLRLWDFYLAYCEAAFTERNSDVVQYVLRRA